MTLLEALQKVQDFCDWVEEDSSRDLYSPEFQDRLVRMLMEAAQKEEK